MTCSRPQRNVHRPGFEPGTPWSDIRRPNHCATPSDIADDYLDKRITESEVLRAIRNLKTGKTGKPPGIDGLSIQFIKTSPQHLVPSLAELFNTFYDSGYFPPEWATSILAPIHKKGSKDDPNNYRGVSLLPEISKIFTSIINA